MSSSEKQEKLSCLNYQNFQSTQSSKGAATRLGHVADRFSSLYNDLEQIKQERLIAEAAKHTQLAEGMQKLENKVQLEVQRRQEMNSKLQSHFESEIGVIEQKLTQQLFEVKNLVKTCFDALGRGIKELAQELRAERDARQHDINRAFEGALEKISECSQHLEEEQQLRVDKEQAFVKRIEEDLIKYQDRQDQDKMLNDKQFQQIYTQLQQISNAKSHTDDKFQQLVLDEFKSVKYKLSQEQNERKAEDEAIVSAVNEYIKALQDGLRLVSSS